MKGTIRTQVSFRSNQNYSVDQELGLGKSLQKYIELKYQRRLQSQTVSFTRD